MIIIKKFFLICFGGEYRNGVCKRERLSQSCLQFIMICHSQLGIDILTSGKLLSLTWAVVSVHIITDRPSFYPLNLWPKAEAGGP